MVTFRIKPGSRNKAVEAFEARGPNRNPGVSLLNAWIGTKSDEAFVLVESADLSLVEKAALNWQEHGEYEIIPVVSVEQF
jgi:hypothetical protein